MLNYKTSVKLDETCFVYLNLLKDSTRKTINELINEAMDEYMYEFLFSPPFIYDKESEMYYAIPIRSDDRIKRFKDMAKSRGISFSVMLRSAIVYKYLTQLKRDYPSAKVFHIKM